MSKKAVAVGCLLAGATMVVACGNDDSSSSPSTSATVAKPSLLVSVSPAPSQADAKKTVSFDPCFAVSDELVTKAGFDPATRERSAGEVVTPSLTTIGCTFKGQSSGGENDSITYVSVESSNFGLDHIRNNPDRTVFNSDPIDGREAVLYRTAQMPGTCSAAIKSTDGVLDVSLMAYTGAAPAAAPCDQIRQVAETFASALG
ncbi:DUF3558 domain-containing protein [Nocardia huaxiensis]|uniref:DUF3558 domain-containing protein n=1 Tax=Nocardia huaxiensis TaxID=2755382 RepID=UPI001E5EC122|nr:DUF3558 domain-containing protein [Nocardia huaxiensis]UFS95470.1 DUF3558 domain-containing protein [Nocardia huaxiensis]